MNDNETPSETPVTPSETSPVPERPAAAVVGVTPLWEVIEDIGNRLRAIQSSDPRVAPIVELIDKATVMAKGVLA